MQKILKSILLAPVALSGLISIASAPVLYFSRLTPLAIGVIVTASLLILLLFLRQKNVSQEPNNPHTPISLLACLPILVSCTLSILTLFLLLHSQTVETTLGPWETVSPVFFILVFLNLCVLILAGITDIPFGFLAPALSVFFVSIASVLSIVYPLGFGFDPLLHSAAERIIAEQGTLLPKTQYYLGHYGLIVILSKIFHAPLELFNKFFFIDLAALTLPILFFQTFCALSLSKRTASIATIIVLSLTSFSPIASGTPWGSAFFFAIVAILASVLFIIEKNKAHAGLLIIATGALFAIHPLAGLPLLGFLPYAFFKKPTLILKTLLLGISASAVGVAFLILSKISTQLPVEITSFYPEAVFSFFASFLPRWEWRSQALLDPVYLLTQNMHSLLLGGCVASFIIFRKSSANTLAAITMLGFGFLGTAFSYIVTRAVVSFPSLPMYEQAIYTDRIQEISWLFLSILSCFTIGVAIEKIINQKNRLLLFVTVLIIGTMGVMHVYASYPRNDAYIPYHGHTISKHDIEAVHWIDDHANGKDYVVLSNQVTAAASIKEFGFAKYFSIPKNGSTYSAFYYSIPASSPLHESFEAMLGTPSRMLIDDVMSRFKVERVYFVVHSYEPRFRNVIDKTKPLADEWYSIDNEKVTVFAFYGRSAFTDGSASSETR